MSTTSSFGLSLNTPIDRVVMLIGRRLCFEDDYDFKVEKWIRLLKDNWIQTVGTLTRIPAGSLSQLGLPLALVVELERIVKLANDYKGVEFFHIQNDGGSGDSRFRLKLSQGQKDLVNTSFRALLKVNSSTGKTGLGQFETEFYPMFFKRNPAGQRLFEMSEIATQSKAFVRMLYWIVENLDNQDLGPVLSQLGGRHLIYGVQDDEYQLFASAMCDTFKGILGKNFTEHMARAWMETLMALAGLMKEAGEITAAGYQGQLKKERENGSWQLMYVTLHLDTLYLYKDKQRKSLSGQYPIRGVLQIQFPKDLIQYAFQLTSFDPPFTIRLAAVDEEQFNAWISEFDWRISAIQRVYKAGDDSSLEDSSEIVSASTNDMSGLNSDAARKAKETKRKIAKKQRKLQAKMEKKDLGNAANDEMKAILDAGLGLSDEEKATIKASWKCLVEKRFTDAHGVSKSGIGKLFEDFYAKLFEVNPAGKRLFESTGLKAQGRALVSMIGMIVRCLDDFSTFSSHIRELGGRHKIYGVAESDYEVFSFTLARTISTLLQDETQFPIGSVEKCWMHVLGTLSKMMVAAAHTASHDAFVVVVQRRMTVKGSWKKTAIALQLDSLYVYTNEKLQKLRTSIMLNTITSIDLHQSEGDMPSDFGVVVAYGDETATFCFATKEEATAFMGELNWRVQAVLRVFKYDDDSASEGGEAAHSSKSVKAHKFSLAKKKVKKDGKK